ncbi:MAG: alpha/beta hydrolase [Aeoliella sp.]
MNRSPLTSQPNTSTLSPKSQSCSPGNSRRVFSAASAPTVAAHCSFTPIHYEQGYAYPLVIWLHGPESNEEEVQQVMPLVSMRNHVAIAPRGTQCSEQIAGAYNWDSSPSDTEEAAERVESCISYAQEQLNIHPDRIFLAGYSTGGTLALRLAMEFPEMVTGAISLGGSLPQGYSPFKRIYEARKKLFMLAVSPNDKYTEEKVREDVLMFRIAGFPLELRLYPEGDKLCTKMLSDMDDWIVRSVCPKVISSYC